jgi:hyperosmotically inducible protein
LEKLIFTIAVEDIRIASPLPLAERFNSDHSRSYILQLNFTIMRLIILVAAVFAIACNRGPSDEQLQTQLSSTLSSSFPGVTASVKDKVVTLAGTCPDEACKTSSETTAKNVKGVKNVVNNITVSAPPVTQQPEISADSALKTSVDNLLSAYKTVDATVQNGVVTLTGEVKRSQLTTLMQSVNELKPKKVENKLVIK